jgi:PrtD family type I secretion system ABC transporter
MTCRRHAGEQDALDQALASVRHAFLTAGIFSLFINLLMLAGPLYMLQVYDRVLTSHSIPTLVALTILLVVLYVALGLLEGIRSQVLNRVAGRLDRILGPALLETVSRCRLETGRDVADEPLRDLAVVRQFVSGSGPPAFFDVPWSPIFLAITFMIHWTLGAFALAAALVMVALALLNELGTKSLFRRGKTATDFATRMAAENGRNTEAMVAMAMTEPMVDRWRYAHGIADDMMRRAGDRMVAFSTATRTLRLFVQSGLLAIGAVLVIKQMITPGMMIAVSIIGGRAVAPIGQAVAQWRSLLAAREAAARLMELLRNFPAVSPKMSLPPPQGRIELQRVCAAPPGTDRPILKNISFALEAGEALGVIGPSAAGKSTLAHVLLGLWQPQSGAVRLDGSDLSVWNRQEIGRKVGYLPQSVELFDGSIAQNISRFYPDATADAVWRAASRAAVHDYILALPEGYNMRIGAGGSRLSAGQRQRIGLARALYGDPVLVVLDEPNANLDAPGEAALLHTLRSLKESGTTVILITHRPAGLDLVDRFLVLDRGEIRAFGPKSSVVQVLNRHALSRGERTAALPEQGNSHVVAQLRTDQRR